MRKIQLTRNKITLVSDKDYAYLNQWNWYAWKSRNTWYAVHNLRVDNRQIRVYLHREILGLKHGDVRKVDHRDGNGLNNQRRNLRLATNGQNQHNVAKQCNNTSGYKGVYWHKTNQKWQALIMYDMKLKHLGYFVCLIEAAKAYDRAARKYHKKFAKTNF